jgi:hypothetical protein
MSALVEAKRRSGRHAKRSINDSSDEDRMELAAGMSNVLGVSHP